MLGCESVIESQLRIVDLGGHVQAQAAEPRCGNRYQERLDGFDPLSEVPKSRVNQLRARQVSGSHAESLWRELGVTKGQRSNNACP